MPPALFSRRSDPQRIARVRLGSSLGAASLDDIFDHSVRPRLVHG